MSVERNAKGQLSKGSTLNPTGRPRNAYARLLAEMKQVEFVKYYYGLFDKTPKELEQISTSPTSTNMERIAARLMYDCMKGGDAGYMKVFLALLGINVSGSTNILLNTAAWEDPDAPTGQEKDITPKENITHIKVVEIIEALANKKKNE